MFEARGGPCRSKLQICKKLIKSPSRGRTCTNPPRQTTSIRCQSLTKLPISPNLETNKKSRPMPPPPSIHPSIHPPSFSPTNSTGSHLPRQDLTPALSATQRVAAPRNDPPFYSTFTKNQVRCFMVLSKHVLLAFVFFWRGG